MAFAPNAGRFNFEKLTSDPHLSTVRRYALAVGAKITHQVEPVELHPFLRSEPPDDEANLDVTVAWSDAVDAVDWGVSRAARLHHVTMGSGQSVQVAAGATRGMATATAVIEVGAE
ncbi:hypothetical protein AB0C34_25985 [Nocardia sp. NPDC049220]|uniref:hypothetical protein n=1 Tax=Nocardia sp. NPDC049220 TaxID=3155273 RepID=UPI0033FFB968